MDEDLMNSINEINGANDTPVQDPFAPAAPAQPAPTPVNPNPTPVGNPFGPAPAQPAPNPQPVSVSPDNFANRPEVKPLVFKNKKKSNAIKIIAAVFLIIALAAGVVAALFLTGVIDGNSNASETVLEDRDYINPIDQKLASLFGEPGDLSIIETTSPHYDDVDLFLNGEYTEEQKLWITFKNLDGYYKEFTEEDMAPIREYWSTTGYEDPIDATAIRGFGAEQFEAKYKEIFGDTPSEIYQNTGRVYHVGNNYFAFNIEEITSADRRFYNKIKYTKEGETIHVYVASATYNMADEKVYCGVYQASAEDRPVACQDVSGTGNYFHSDEMDNGKYSTRRFDFKKSEDGEYYLVSSEITTSPEMEPVINYDIDEDTSEEETPEEESPEVE